MLCPELPRRHFYCHQFLYSVLSYFFISNYPMLILWSNLSVIQWRIQYGSTRFVRTPLLHTATPQITCSPPRCTITFSRFQCYKPLTDYALPSVRQIDMAVKTRSPSRSLSWQIDTVVKASLKLEVY